MKSDRAMKPIVQLAGVTVGDWFPANPSHNDDHPTCCICMTSVDPAGARRLPCSHAFHPECLARCLQHSALCPLCKVPVE